MVIVILSSLLNWQLVRKHNEKDFRKDLIEFINRQENHNNLNETFFINDYANAFNTETTRLNVFDHKNKLIWSIGNPLLENNTSIKIEVSGSIFHYTSYIDLQGNIPEVVLFRNILIFSLILIILISIIVVFIFSILIYKPIRDIRVDIESHMENTFQSSDDLLVIKNSITSYKREMNNLKISSINAAEDYIIPQLLHGEFNSIRQFNSEAKHYNMQITIESFRVLLISIHKMSNFSETQLLTLLEEFNKHHLPGFFRYSYNQSTISYICNFMDNISSLDYIKEKLDLLKRDVYDHAKAELTIGVGNPCWDIKKIGKSTIEAKTCIEYQIIEGDNKIIFFESFDHKHKVDYWYSRHIIQDLELMIREGDAENTKIYLYRYIKSIKDHRYPLFIVKCLYFDIVNTIGHTVKEINIPEIESSRYSFFNEIQYITSIDKLADILISFTEEVASALHNTSSSGKFPLSYQVKEYIDNNLFNPDFYLQRLANDLNQSLPYISQTFKKTYGITMSSYVSRLKLKKAEKLLAETSMKISEIIQEIGYSDRSSFSKKFKAESGFSPNEFRKMIKKKNQLNFS